MQNDRRWGAPSLVSVLPPVSFKQLHVQGLIVHDKFHPSKSGKGDAGKVLPSSCQDCHLYFKHLPSLRQVIGTEGLLQKSEERPGQRS